MVQNTHRIADHGRAFRNILCNGRGSADQHIIPHRNIIENNAGDPAETAFPEVYASGNIYAWRKK